MTSDTVHNKLEMKPVEVEHLEQYDQLLRYVFQVDTGDLEESGYKDNELRQAKRPILQRSEVIGWFDDGSLISSLSIYPCKVNIHGKTFNMAGVTGVGTYPEYANQGLMQELITEALKRMRNNRQWISYLYPFSIPFYRHKGWEIISDHMTFTVPDSQLPKAIEVEGHVERQDIDSEDVYLTYNRFALQNNGALIRSDADWEEYWRWENEEDRTAAIYYDEKNEPLGYILYWIKDDVFYMKEMIYLSQEARIALWNFIGAHFSMIERIEGHTYTSEPIAFLFEDSSIKETIEPYIMARIIDVAEFLKRYPFAKKHGEFHFNVTDTYAEWNNKTFSVAWDKTGKIEVTNEPIGTAIDIDVQTLTSMLMSYRRPTYFQKIERLQVDHNTLELLEEIIPDTQPYFSDYF